MSVGVCSDQQPGSNDMAVDQNIYRSPVNIPKTWFCLRRCFIFGLTKKFCFFLSGGFWKANQYLAWKHCQKPTMIGLQQKRSFAWVGIGVVAGD